MIVHNAIFQLNPALSQQQIDELGAAFLGMKEHIPTIRDISWHDNITDEPLHHGFMHVLRVVFDDKAGLDTYVPHPHHAEICQKYLLPALKSDIQTSVLVLDHELAD